MLKVLINFLLVIGIYFNFGCSSADRIIDKNNISPKKYFENPERLTFKVKDERLIESNAIQSYDGINNYYFNKPVSTYIEEYINSSFHRDTSNLSYKYIKLFIDQLKFEADKSLKYSIRVLIPMGKDSAEVFRLATKFSQSKKLSKNYIEILDYALSSMIDTLLSGLDKETFNKNIVTINHSTAGINKKEVSDKTKETLVISESVKTDVVIKQDFKEKLKRNSINILYCTGEKIENGFQLSYNFRNSSDSLFYFGYGAGLLFYNIKNKEDRIDGFMFSASFPLLIEYYLSKEATSVYIGSALKLSAGNEKIDYGYTEKQYFFFGPTVEPFVGVKLADKVSFDIGPYFIALFGSKILPSDLGFRINFNINIM